MVKSVVGEQRNRRRTRLERPFQTWFAVWSDDTDPRSRYSGCVVVIHVYLQKKHAVFIYFIAVLNSKQMFVFGLHNLVDSLPLRISSLLLSIALSSLPVASVAI